jgi:hypothetical protein
MAGVDLEKYKIEVSENYLQYSFYSRGPKGKIKKIVNFTLVSIWNNEYYNLGFGDWDITEQIIDDTITTNNHDTEKVLASIAEVILTFTNHYPEAYIYVEATTRPRMRLYQMKINKYWAEIEVHFELFSIIEDLNLIPYKPGNKCLGFVGRKKMK